MTEWLNYFDNLANKEIGKAYFGWRHWSDKMNGRLKKRKIKKRRSNERKNKL
tara:strand:+ start:92 stop:247 length:156 start_codon:yes stop_codon:yes gene_type:complete